MPRGLSHVPGTEQVPANGAARHMLADLPAAFVPNLGQWQQPARFVLRRGPVTVFLEDQGFTLDLAAARDQERDRGVALRLSFVGAHPALLVGERKLPGHHNYFLGNDAGRWRTDVPRYASVRYESLYPGIDLRLREADGHPEYDLLLEPGADLAKVAVHVAGGKSLHVTTDGALVIDTALGPVTQPAPRTWQLSATGNKEMLICRYVLLGPDRFGFEVRGWNAERPLTIDPGLLWSTYLGGAEYDEAQGVVVDALGVVTVAGRTHAPGFPKSTGAYDTTHNGGADVFVSQLDPSKTGPAQLLFSTFLGGSSNDFGQAVAVDAGGVVTVVGRADSSGFPTTPGAFDRTHNGGGDVFVSQLDPSKTGSAQLLYSTFLGGSGAEIAQAVDVDLSGAVTIAGATASADLTVTPFAYDKSHNGSFDAFVARLHPRRTGTAQLLLSTFLGGSRDDFAWAVSANASGVVTVTGEAWSSNFPTTTNAYAPSFTGTGTFPPADVFVTRLDPNKQGSAQLLYSTYLGGTGGDIARGLAVDANGVVTVAGDSYSTNFPTTPGAYDTTHNGAQDAFVSRLDPRKTGAAQLLYSTYLGGVWRDYARGLHVDGDGVVTMAGGSTSYQGFPTTPGAYDTTFNGVGSFPGPDAFVARLDPRRTGSAQLVYSTWLGGVTADIAWALAVDESGVATVAGSTDSLVFPTTTGAYDTSFNGPGAAPPPDAFVSRLDMGVALRADRHQLSPKQAGTQNLILDAGKAHAGRFYWIFGSVTGTRPGVTVGVHIPLNPDFYTDFTIGAPNVNPPFKSFRGQLDSNGRATAAFNVPSGLPALPNFTLYHAYLVYDAQGLWHMASNAVPLHLKN
jgi:hypothetical protein